MSAEHGVMSVCWTRTSARRTVAVPSMEVRSRRRPNAPSAPVEPLPLAHRLPNASAVFVGRSEERDHVRTALARGRVAVIWGLGGLGKTALAMEVMHKHFAGRVARTLYIGLQPTGEDVRVRLVRALADAHAATTLDWQALLADADSLVATAIDLADVGDHWIVLDDLQWTDPAHTRHLLAHVARFARRSRWLAISREDPGLSDLAPDTVALEAMGAGDLSRLATLWAPRRPRGDIQRAVHTAGGSPWQLRRALFGAPAADTAARDVLADLTPATRSFVLALARVYAPVTTVALSRVVCVPDEATLSALERRGLLEHGPRGWRLHDVARAMVTAASTRPRDDDPPALDESRLADVLVTEPDAVTAFEGLRLLARQQRDGDVLRALDARGEAWLAIGLAPDVWRLLEPMPGAARGGPLSRWRLRCTVEFDSRDVLTAVDAEKQPTPADQLAWARVLFRRGRIDAAALTAADAARTAGEEGERQVAVDAALLHAGATAQQGREREALSLLAAIDPPDEASRARLDALAAMLLTALDERDAARDRLVQLRRVLPTLADAAQIEVAFGVVQALYFLGQYRDADDVVRDVVERRGEPALALYHGRRLLYYRACIAIERGQFDAARTLLARLEPFVQGHSMFRAFVDYAACMLDLAVGDIDAVRARLPRTIEGGLALGEWNPHHVEALLLQARLAMLTGAAPELPDASVLPSTGYPARVRVQLHRVEAALRSGTHVSTDPWPDADACPAWGDTQAIARLVRARAALMAGRDDEARAQTALTLAAAHESGSAVLEAEAWQLEAEVCLARGDAAGVARAAAWMEAFGRSAPSRRYADEGRLFAMAGSAEAMDPAVLEQLAAATAGSPRASRRARALLGSAPRDLDAFDRRVVATLERTWGAAWRVVPVVANASTEWSPGWGLDPRTQSVWFPSGARVALADRPILWRVLEVLAERGGQATKEDLACAVWNERAYHPLKHDNRLRLAVRKLRQALEPGTDGPPCVLTLEDGYALAPGARRLVRQS